MALDSEVIDRAIDSAEAKIESTTEAPETSAPVEKDIPAKDPVEEAVEADYVKKTAKADKPAKEPTPAKKLPVKEYKKTTFPSGKSASKQELISSDQDADVAVEAAPTEETTPEEPLNVPTYWSAELKAVAAKAPRAVVEEFAKHDALREQWARRTADEGRKGKVYEQRHQEVFGPHETKLRASGIRDGYEAAERLLAWNELFEKDPKTGIADLMRKNNLTPTDFYDDGTGQYNQGGDPRVEEELAAMKEARESYQKQVQDQQNAAVYSRINAFKAGTDSKGRPRATFAQAYAPQIDSAYQAIIKEYPHLSMEDALHHSYEFVLSETEKLLGTSTPKAPVKTQEKVIADANKAKNAASSVTGAPSNGASAPGRPKGRTLDETINSVLDRAGY